MLESLSPRFKGERPHVGDQDRIYCRLVLEGILGSTGQNQGQGMERDTVQQGQQNAISGASETCFPSSDIWWRDCEH